MKAVLYKDERGYLWKRLIKDRDPDMNAQFGVPIGPPDLEQIDWDALKKEVNNSLAQAGIFTWEDLQRNQQSFLSAVSIFRRHLVLLYRDQVSKTNHNGR